MIEQVVLWAVVELAKLLAFCGLCFFLYVAAFHLKAMLRRRKFNKRVYRNSGKRAR